MDLNFGVNGVSNIDFLETSIDNPISLVSQSTNKIILAGRTKSGSSTLPNYISLTRIQSNGMLDTDFGNSGYVNLPTNLTGGSTLGVDVLIDNTLGKLYVIGITNNSNTTSLYRLNLNSSTLANQEITKSVIKIYPKPTKSILYFSQELSEIKVVDMLGKQVYSKKEKTQNICVEKIPNGTYLIIAKNKMGGDFSEKFIKQ